MNNNGGMSMEHRNQLISSRSASLAVLVVMAVVATGAASATEWRALAGAQSPGLGSQALAFLPAMQLLEEILSEQSALLGEFFVPLVFPSNSKQDRVLSRRVNACI